MNPSTATTMNSPISKETEKEVDTPATAPCSETEEAPEDVDDDEYETAFSKMQNAGPMKKSMRRGKAYGVSALESLTDDRDNGANDGELDISTFAMDDFREGRKSGIFDDRDLEEWDGDGDSLRDGSIGRLRGWKAAGANDDDVDEAGQESGNSDHEGFTGKHQDDAGPASDIESDEEEVEFTEASGYGFSQGNVRAGEVADDEEKASVTIDDAEGHKSGQNASVVDETDATEKSSQAESEVQEMSNPVPSAVSEPSISELYNVVDAIFHAADKDIMTVKQVNKSVAAHFGLDRLDKKMKELIKERLTALVSGKIVVGSDEDSGKGEKSRKSKKDKEKKSTKKAAKEYASEDEFQGDVEMSDEEEEAGNDSSSDYDEPANRLSKKSKKSRKQSHDNESFSDASVSSDSKPKKSRKNRRRSSKSGKMAKHIRDHATKTRLRQLEEARIRQEELGNIASSTNCAKKEQDTPKLSEEDRLRAQAIAARFDTNREEEVLKREEDRVGLIDILRRKRLEIITLDDGEMDSKKELPETTVQDDELKVERENVEKSGGMVDLDDDEEDSSNDEDDELEIITPTDNAIASTSGVKKASVLDCLFSKSGCSSASRVPRNSSSKPVADPRLALRNALRAKQMKAGNRWLARELGYKTEEDHIRDCMEAELKKRKQILFLEKQAALRGKDEPSINPAFDVRVAANSDDHYASGDEEDDEEVAMARHLEQTDIKSEVGSEKAEEEMSDQDNSGDFADEDDLNPVEDGQGRLDEWRESKPIDETIPVLAQPSPSKITATLVSPSDANEAPQVTPTQTDESSCIDANQETVGHTISEQAEVKINSVKSATEEVFVDNTINTAKPEQDLADATETADSSYEKQENKPDKPRNSAWQALLQKEKESLAKQKKLQRRGGGLVEGEAEEEEEEEGIVGLEDFGFSIEKKKDEDSDDDVEADADDLDHVVDELSDNEGDEEAGEQARKRLEAREEKERHKEIMRRMREGYDGRRGGIASGIGGARGIHRFDQLVAADNREDAKRLGLLNEDEMDSDEEEAKTKKDVPDDEDEAALLDRMLKERFLNREDDDLFEETFSDEEEEAVDEEEATGSPEDDEEKEQERLAKRFAKRARMNRILEAYEGDNEFSRSRLIDEDTTMQIELKSMKVHLFRLFVLHCS
eukprot:CCRYP_002714-RC/>CCRYP_002714-RC protein AED:0.01 eAED:0.01 QI:82/1/1/1/1/1/3/769/1160